MVNSANQSSTFIPVATSFVRIRKAWQLYDLTSECYILQKHWRKDNLDRLKFKMKWDEEAIYKHNYFYLYIHTHI